MIILYVEAYRNERLGWARKGANAVRPYEGGGRSEGYKWGMGFANFSGEKLGRRSCIVVEFLPSQPEKNWK